MNVPFGGSLPREPISGKVTGVCLSFINGRVLFWQVVCGMLVVISFLRSKG